MEYGVTQENQFHLHERMGPHLSSTVFYDAVYKALLVGDVRQMLPLNPVFQVEYRNGFRAGEAYTEDLQVDPRFICFDADPKFEAAVRKGVARERQYLVNLFGPKGDSGEPIP